MELDTLHVARTPDAKAGGGLERLSPQKIASGCAGAPVDPTRRSGVAVKRNS
jgi:hypothetical protein